VLSVLDERLRVPVALKDDALGLIVVEENVVLQRAGVHGPHELHALSGQALELLELALVKREPTDTLKLTHCSGLQTPALLTGIDALGALAAGWLGFADRTARRRDAGAPCCMNRCAGCHRHQGCALHYARFDSCSSAMIVTSLERAGSPLGSELFQLMPNMSRSTVVWSVSPKRSPP
jgi:hypothetical protein